MLTEPHGKMGANMCVHVRMARQECTDVHPSKLTRLVFIDNFSLYHLQHILHLLDVYPIQMTVACISTFPTVIFDCQSFTE